HAGEHRRDEQERGQHDHQIHEGRDVHLLRLFVEARAASEARAHAAASPRRSTIVFRNLTEAISRLSTSSVVLVWSRACTSSSGIATIRPKAVVFIATEIDAESRSAFSAGLALETAVNAWMRPTIVPSRPRSVARLAKVAR